VLIIIYDNCDKHCIARAVSMHEQVMSPHYLDARPTLAYRHSPSSQTSILCLINLTLQGKADVTGRNSESVQRVWCQLSKDTEMSIGDSSL